MKAPVLIMVLAGVTLATTACRDGSRITEGADPDGYASAALERQRPEAHAAVLPDAVSAAPAAVRGASHIPYPVYPNGNRYRIGGEHGLRIVVYQTDDTFAAVDAYYRDATVRNAMPRLEAMQDYVRYSVAASDDDPWATARPGIVIHELDSDEQRRAVGARHSARTNIIMSF